MAAYAPVCGLELMEWLYDVGKISDRRLFAGTMMFMAHDVIAKKTGYIRFVERLRRDGKIKTIILDNSLVEVLDGTTPPLNFDDILEVCDAIEADYTILPDVMGDGSASAKATHDAYEEFIAPSGHFAFVLQGENVMFHVAQAAAYSMEMNAKMLCVPRIIGNTMGSRKATLRAIGADVINSYKIHLLGCSRDIRDDIECCRENIGVNSIDSANPIVAGFNGDIGDRNHWKRPEHYFNLEPLGMSEYIRKLITDNVEEFQGIVRYAGRDA